jgi:hypothetical protein
MIFHVEYIIELISHQSTSESHYLYPVIYSEIFFDLDFEQGWPDGRTDFRGVRGLGIIPDISTYPYLIDSSECKRVYHIYDVTMTS